MKIKFSFSADKNKEAPSGGPPPFATPENRHSKPIAQTTPAGGKASLIESDPVDPEIEVFHLIDKLMRHPGCVLTAIKLPGADLIKSKLALISTIGLLLFGAAVAAFAGGEFYFFVPLKVLFGGFLSIALCAPSLYVFANLSEIRVSFSEIWGVLLTLLGIISLLLCGFTPVVLIFSLSTQSLSWAGFLCLLSLVVSSAFGLTLLTRLPVQYRTKVASSFKLHVWMLIFILVVLQMPTMLAPFFLRQNEFVTAERQFFLSQWLETLEKDPKRDGSVEPVHKPSMQIKSH